MPNLCEHLFTYTWDIRKINANVYFINEPNIYIKLNVLNFFLII